MAIELATQFTSNVDEQFAAESRRQLLTIQGYDWTGAHSIKVYKITTSQMNDYNRAGETDEVNWSRFGPVKNLDASTEELTLTKDRSFTFVIDLLDEDETARAVAAAGALARQNREVVIPEIDSYIFNVMCTNAGTKPAAKTLTVDNLYDEIIAGSAVLDNAEVPETERVLVVNPETYRIMKKCPEIVMDTDVGNELRLKGVIGIVDGMTVIKVPANRLPEGFGFMLAHPCATVAPVKLETYRIHEDPPGISGALVEGRICYDAFVLDNKALAIYYQAHTAAAAG